MRRALQLAALSLSFLIFCAFGSAMPCLFGTRGLLLFVPSYFVAFLIFRQMQAMEAAR